MELIRYLLLIALISALPLVETFAAPNMELEECRRLAMQGEAEAQWQLGQRYETGDGVKQDAMRAIAQYKKAADQGHREACAKLASYYESGTLVGKNPSQAAKYRAMADGEDPDLAVADAKATAKAKRYDEVEVAIDYIIGRNGKEKDPKTGIRLLYSAAKDNPDAQRVFCEAWSADAVDVGEIDAAEWELVIPWFRKAFENGLRTCGHVLGIDAFERKNFPAVIQYWTAAGKAGVAKSWYFLGSFYSESLGTKAFHGPKHLHDERKAKAAFEKASAQKWGGQEDALFMFALICLYATDKENLDYKKAFRIFRDFLQQEPDNPIYLLDYGWAGIRSDTDGQFAQLEDLNWQLRGQSFAPAVRRDMEARREQIKRAIGQTVRHYMRYIKQAADKGYESAQKDFNYLNGLFGY